MLRTDLINASNKVSDDDAVESAYANAVRSATNKLSAFLTSQSAALGQLPDRTNELRDLIAKAQDSLSKPENRTPELIKRLALGVVISTFFLALLRYLGNLYRARYLQVMQAERDDFLVRRFYVALKSSVNDDQQRRTVLSDFMAIPDEHGGIDDKLDPNDSSKQEFEIVRELVKALSKKL